jgi:hypothetical protein
LYWTLDAIENNRSRIDQVKALLRHADLGISDVQIQRREFTEEQRKRILKVAKAMLSDGSEASAPTFEDDFIEREFERVSTTVKLHHACDDGTSVPLDFDDESLGTKSLVALSGPVLQALDLGFTLLVDEVDTSLHPRIVAEVVGLFQSPVTNPAQAQLIFTTHDTSLLNSTVDERPLLDRDQVWLVEKDRTGATSVYPLSDFSPRKHENLERGYLQGRYGGVPFIDDEGLRQELEVAGGALGANGS